MYINNDEIWKEISKKIIIPNKNLENVNYIVLKNKESIPKKLRINGNYWIVTNEPINHSFNNNKHPDKIYNNYKIIYNGVATNLYGRIINHLFNSRFSGMSGISVDLYCDVLPKKQSHTKAAYGLNKKTPFINDNGIYRRISAKKDLLFLNLSDKEKDYIISCDIERYYFYNGIDITTEKHCDYEWRFYYLPSKESSLSSFIEQQWRKKYGYPQLCSYKEGR